MTDSASTNGPGAVSPRLADHTSLRVGGPARRFVVATKVDELLRTVSECDERGEPVLILGGGSNLLVSDEGFDGTVVKVAMRGLTAEQAAGGQARVRVAAGELWDDFVATSILQRWRGLEALSGIPGLVGSVPIQNVGAYGAEVSQVIHQIRAWDRQQREFQTVAVTECGFGYRASRFKADPGRYVIVEVDFSFESGILGEPIRYPELANRLGVAVGEQAPAAEVRRVVLEIRRSKGMVLDASDHDSWSAGSFFTNPILSAAQAATLPAEAPRYPAGDMVKTSAAWLIQAAGFAKGHGSGPATLSTKHVLALTNRGKATAADVVALAREVRAGVAERFGVELKPEVNLINVTF